MGDRVAQQQDTSQLCEGQQFATKSQNTSRCVHMHAAFDHVF
jgi:hypothetical protein